VGGRAIARTWRGARPRVVSLDEVKITREGDSARFDYADDAIGSLVLTLGVDVSEMSGERWMAMTDHRCMS
jgi:hypothetical protein